MSMMATLVVVVGVSEAEEVEGGAEPWDRELEWTVEGVGPKPATSLVDIAASLG